MPFRHGVITPARKAGQTPARVINARSQRRRTPNKHIRIDKLLRSARPRILIKRRLGGIGDVLMTTPLLKALKELIPRCELTYATDIRYAEGSLAEVIQHNPYVDRLISNEQIRDGEYDYAVDITATGLDRERSGAIPPNRIDMFAEEVGVSVEGDPVPTYIVTKEERTKATKLIDGMLGQKRKDEKIIAVQVRSNDARRTWALDNMQKLCEILTEDEDTHVLVMDWGSTVKRWQRTNPRIHLFMDKSIADTAAVLEQVDIVVCPDSSMLHLAGALDKKIVAIFGPIPPQSRINHYVNATAVHIKLPCSNCVVGDSLVLTNKGYKQIRDIEPGDKAYTTNGKFEAVTKVHENDRKDRDLIELSIFGSNEPVTVTKDHKVLIAKREHSWKKEDWERLGSRRRVPKLSKPEWTEAGKIKERDYCCLPKPKREDGWINPLLQNEQLSWLVGLFVAEGWTSIPKRTSRSYEATLSLGSDETDLIDNIKYVVEQNPHVFSSTHHNKGFVRTRPNSRGDSTLVTISNKTFITMLHTLFGVADGATINRANEKKIPISLFSCEENIISSFLTGLKDGDGYTDSKDTVYSTASRELAYGIQLLCTRLGKFPKVYRRVRDTNFKKDAVIYRVYESKEKERKRWYEDDKFVYVPVKRRALSVRTDDKVYDITVENSPTFTIQNISIFDCWYSPRCTRGTGKKMECLTGITPEMVKQAVQKKIVEPTKTRKAIIYGKDLTDKGQDPIILIRRETTGLGDMLMVTPAISAIKKKFPNKKVHVASQRNVWPVLQNNPEVDQLLDVHDTFNYKRYFMVIDISSPCARYESARVAARKPVQKSRVEIFAEAMNVRNTIPSLKPMYYPTEEETEWAKKFLKDNTDPKKLNIAVGVSSAEQYRNWPEKSHQTLFNILWNKFNLIVLDNNREYAYEKIVDARGLPIRKAAAIVSQADGLITVDTCFLHFAAALDIPTVAIFGPIDYKARCKGYNNVTVIKSEMRCIPCWRNSKIACKETGHIRGFSKCISSIKPHNVAKTIMQKFTGK